MIISWIVGSCIGPDSESVSLPYLVPVHSSYTIERFHVGTKDGHRRQRWCSQFRYLGLAAARPQCIGSFQYLPASLFCMCYAKHWKDLLHSTIKDQWFMAQRKEHQRTLLGKTAKLENCIKIVQIIYSLCCQSLRLFPSERLVLCVWAPSPRLSSANQTQAHSLWTSHVLLLVLHKPRQWIAGMMSCSICAVNTIYIYHISWYMTRYIRTSYILFAAVSLWHRANSCVFLNVRFSRSLGMQGRTRTYILLSSPSSQYCPIFLVR